jgi:hypothetical protein
MQIHFTLSIQYLIFFVFIFLSAMKDEDIWDMTVLIQQY